VVLVAAFIYATIHESKNKIEKNRVSSYFPKSTTLQENTPLKKSDVRERLDRELIVNINYTSTNLSYEHRAFPIIEPIPKKRTAFQRILNISQLLRVV
jgi:hypothetical protein